MAWERRSEMPSGFPTANDRGFGRVTQGMAKGDLAKSRLPHQIAGIVVVTWIRPATFCTQQICRETGLGKDKRNPVNFNHCCLFPALKPFLRNSPARGLVQRFRSG